MSDNPFIWNIGESIPINLYLTDPNTGLSLPGQDGYLSLTIQRSDNLYWTGTAWAATLTVLAFEEVDAVNYPGRYLYTLSSSGNSQANRYMVHASINNPAVLVGDAYELHISRDLTTKFYESEPS